MTLRHYCTYFDRNYLYRGLALYRSLNRHSPEFVLWVLCFDNTTYEILTHLQLPSLHPISLQAFEADDVPLLQAKRNRSQVEYYFTCTPSLLLYVLNHNRDIDLLTYVDADLFFFGPPEPIYREFANGSILIVGHRFPPEFKHLEVFGTYNVGLMMFRRDDSALECLRLWREQCLEWCYDDPESGRFADQKYLDDWPSHFENVVVLQHKGAGLAPWNLSNYRLRAERGQILVDSDPLVFYHFHGFKTLSRWLFDMGLWSRGKGLAKYLHAPDHVVKHHIYSPYVRELRNVWQWVEQTYGTRGGSVNLRSSYDPKSFLSMLLRRNFLISHSCWSSSVTVVQPEPKPF